MPPPEIPDYLQRAVSFDRGYFGIELRESQQALVDLETAYQEWELPVSFAPDLLNGFQRRYWVRRGLLAPLRQVSHLLAKQQRRLHFTYGYRTAAEQRAVYEFYVRQMWQRYAPLAAEQLLAIAGVYAACNPATAAHMGGAAVDVMLEELDGTPVDLGAAYLADGPVSETQTKLISARARHNRQQLLAAMTAAGFANYPFEFWHFSLGDRIAAYIQGRPYAVYGPVHFNPQSGELAFFDGQEQHLPFDVSQLLAELGAIPV